MKAKILYIICICIAFSGIANAFGVIADVSPNRIDIHSNFDGKTILVFGALMQEVDNVVVIVHGPKKDTVIRKKIKVFGIWANGSKLVMHDFPQFFSFSSSEDGSLRRYLMERFIPFLHGKSSIDADAEMEAALLENRRKSLLYQSSNSITIINNRLFRGKIRLPGNIIHGAYTIEVLALNGNRIVALESIPLMISKIGIDAWISDLSHYHNILYGILCLVGALLIGWLSFAISNFFQADRLVNQNKG